MGDYLGNSQHTRPNASYQSSMNNLYDSSYFNTTQQAEANAVQQMWRQSQHPTQTGVVPRPAYADMFTEGHYLDDAMTRLHGNGNASAAAGIDSLSGERLSVEQFTHNNMQPFFKKHTTQNVDPTANDTLLQMHTGARVYRPVKKEVECFFEPTAGLGNVCGMGVQSDFYMSRMEQPRARNNDFPISPVHVGPGIGKGFTSVPSGGKQQSETLDFVRPKTVDELRTAGNRQKTQYESRIQGPQKGTSQRGELPNLAKNRPDTFHENHPENMLPNKNAITKGSYRPVEILKPTSRVNTHVSHEGIVNASIYHPGRGLNDDYGKARICIYDNERQTTETKTVVANIRSAISAMIAPFTDILRRTPKEYFVDAPRTFGQFQTQMPNKPTLYDPVDHAMKTTIKETTIHDGTILNLHGNDKGPLENKDPMKTTVRETLPVEDTVRNVSSHTYRVVSYNPDAVARVTIREMTEGSTNPLGYVHVPNGTGAYNVIKVELDPTQKEYVSNYEYYGSAGAKTEFVPPSHENFENAEIDGTREMMNMKAGYTPNPLGANQNVSKDSVDMQMRRALSDDYAAREFNNITHVAQQITPMDECSITKPANQLKNQGEERLDPNILRSLEKNPYKIRINPIVDCP